MADNSGRGLASADEQTRERGADYSKMGEKGGHAAQSSGHAHQLTEEERSEGGSDSGGNFKNDPDRASEAGKKGGSH